VAENQLPLLRFFCGVLSNAFSKNNSTRDAPEGRSWFFTIEVKQKKVATPAL
jgi:hypothetical protein